MKGMILIKVQVNPRNPGKNVPYPVKIPAPDRPEIKFLDPTRPDTTRPENILKNVLDPGPVSVRSGPGKLGVSGCPAGL